MVLQYTNGSPCERKTSKRDLVSLDTRASDEKTSAISRKSATISFHCEKDPLATQAVTSFVGTDPDQCSFFFEVRSQAACGGAEPVESREGLGPGGVFGVILLIAVLVYFLGGVMYQRSVAHARGWRQLPNYSMWAGIGSFFKVSPRNLFSGLLRNRSRRVASVREGLLPTMTQRPLSHQKQKSSRSSYGNYPP